MARTAHSPIAKLLPAAATSTALARTKKRPSPSWRSTGLCVFQTRRFWLCFCRIPSPPPPALPRLLLASEGSKPRWFPPSSSPRFHLRAPIHTCPGHWRLPPLHGQALEHSFAWVFLCVVFVVTLYVYARADMITGSGEKRFFFLLIILCTVFIHILHCYKAHLNLVSVLLVGTWASNMFAFFVGKLYDGRTCVHYTRNSFVYEKYLWFFSADCQVWKHFLGECFDDLFVRG